MTDAKQAAAPAGKSFRGSDATKQAEDVVYVQNNTRTPWVITVGKTLAPRRITPVDGKLWAGFVDTDFGKTLIDDGSIEETTAEAAAGQPKSAQDLQAEQDAADRAARQTASKKAKK
jgi:hypothetical protein